MTPQPQHGRFRDRENPETMHDKPHPHPPWCIHASETADGQYVCFKKKGCEQQRFTSPPLAFCNDISHSSAGAQQRIDRVIKELEAKLTEYRAKGNASFSHADDIRADTLEQAIALLKERPQGDERG